EGRGTTSRHAHGTSMPGAVSAPDEYSLQSHVEWFAGERDRLACRLPSELALDRPARRRKHARSRRQRQSQAAAGVLPRRGNPHELPLAIVEASAIVLVDAGGAVSSGVDRQAQGTLDWFVNVLFNRPHRDDGASANV